MLSGILTHGTELVALVLPISIAATNIVFFPLLAVWLLGSKVTFQRWPPKWGLFEKVFIVYLAISLLSAALAVDVHRGFSVIWKTDLYIVIAVFLTAVVVSEEQNKKLLQIFLWAGGIVAVLGFIQYFAGVDQSDKSGGHFYHLPKPLANFPRPILDLLSMVNGRVLGTRGHPLSYAECLLFNWAFGLCFLLTTVGRARLKWLLYLLLIGGALMVSQSRGPWLAAVVMVLVAGAMVGMKRTMPLVILGGVFAAVMFTTPSFYKRAASITDKTHHSNSDRIDMWKAGITLFKYRPVLGVGPGGVKVLSPPFQHDIDRREGPWGHLHNNYIHYLAERGALGLFTWLAFMLAICKELLDRYRTSQNGYRKLVYWGTGLSMIGFFVGGITETSYNSVVVMMTFYFVVGLALALSRHEAT